HEEPVHPELAAAARHDLQRAFAALDALPPKERVAFSMFHLDGKSQDEIGEVLGHGKSYVCKLIQRATERLRGLGWEVPDAAPCGPDGAAPPARRPAPDAAASARARGPAPRSARRRPPRRGTQGGVAARARGVRGRGADRRVAGVEAAARARSGGAAGA